MRDLLPASGDRATVGNLGFYGSILFCVFLVGWGCAFLWGPIADRFGRVRALIFAILCYSLFTFLGCIAQNIWQLGLFRFLAGFGVGGEFVGAAVFVAEELPGRPSRIRGRLSEFRLLRRDFSCRRTQLSSWRAPGMAGHVRRRDSRPPCSLPSSATASRSLSAGRRGSKALAHGRRAIPLCPLLARVSRSEQR